MKWQDNFLKKEVPVFKVGDLVKVSVKVKEGDKERIQMFEGTVIRRKGSGLDETFTVRKMTAGIGIERVFLVHAPVVDKVKVEKKGDVRRAKLYYIRDKVGKDSRIKEEAAAVSIDAVPAEEEKKPAAPKDEKK